MTELKFSKYDAIGDTGVIIENFDGAHDALFKCRSKLLVIVDGVRGIGANMVVELRRHPLHLYRMRVFLGGEEATMCGNGSRNGVAHAALSQWPGTEGSFTFLANDGVHVGEYDARAKHASVSMADIPEVIKLDEDVYFANTGMPHLVVLWPQPLDDLDVEQEGQRIGERWRQYNVGSDLVIVDFVHLAEEGTVHARCHEANAGHEVLSCGTGATAVTVCLQMKLQGDSETSLQSRKEIKWPGGTHIVSFTQTGNSFTNIRLSGAVRRVFTGVYYY